uniref:Penicillin-binding protein 2 n=1 Tax=candidate division WOR-3 bacterium TaxID=2052148 RepID=A0A7C4X9N7_UNCW3
MRGAKFIHFFLFFISFLFFGYLFFIQCIKFGYYRRISEKTHQKKVILCGSRGNIFDRNGLALATSEPCFSVFCTPQYAKDKKRLATEIALISQRPVFEIKRLLEDNKFFWLEMKVNVEKRDRYLNLNDPSIGYTHDLRRIYTMPDVFGSIIGRCSMDNRGIEGIELYFDEILSGKSGFVVYQKDPSGELFPYYNYPEEDPKPGKDLYLTIDLQLQTILYTQLKECLNQKNAKATSGLIINPRTGEILAMVNISKDGKMRNSAVCDEFEPGSTFKIVGLAFALSNGIKETELFNTNAGKININGHIIHDYKNYGIITLSEAIVHSSNVVMSMLAERFNQDNFLLMTQDFGFTEITGIEFPGEAAGHLAKTKKLNQIEFATLLFGQGITCNLLQLAFAYQAIANNGVLNKPIILSQVRDKKKIVYQTEPLRVRRVVDEDIARRITKILCEVVDEGTGTGAKLDGVRVAGKTGTAQKAVNGQYSTTQITATFVGYFPADNPEYLVALMVDEPQNERWASTIVAPVFKQIAQRICQIRNFEYAFK